MHCLVCYRNYSIDVYFRNVTAMPITSALTVYSVCVSVRRTTFKRSVTRNVAHSSETVSRSSVQPRPWFPSCRSRVKTAPQRYYAVKCTYFIVTLLSTQFTFTARSCKKARVPSGIFSFPDKYLIGSSIKTKIGSRYFCGKCISKVCRSTSKCHICSNNFAPN